MGERRTRIPVLETFGPTVQGEGMVIGVKTCFVRTAGCDYSCSWCDSAFTWDGSAKADIRWLEPEDVLTELKALSGGEWPGHVTLSGGNPALLPQLGGLIALLQGGGTIVALETQGSRWQDWFPAVDELTLSPKPPSSGMATDWARLDEIVERLAAAGRTPSLKVVVMEEPFDGPQAAGSSGMASGAAGAGSAGESCGARSADETSELKSADEATRSRSREGASRSTSADGTSEAARPGSDLAYAKEVHRRFPAVPMFLQAGNDRLDEPEPAALREHLAARYERLVDAVMADPDWRRVRVLPQLHAWLWGNKRGV
ncbi:7-carboxy-7-deazaguanine synthase QueE [Paenibacillus albicereus]|uniref:7-carboxy-7-deazaguanine synthase n=1 Tax=Paenibacillus albicereus TaxID=2726185 RepID=A0A6H2GT14_9BACL|nr:7-carboxy-7-deazaguanine synthase QueE [Paenibacillus albicereus]QJC50571.1 7-carboxy-7-deazaguanine synthase QueE [Paenibacillus albicereus]